MIVNVTTGLGENLVSVDWNDTGELCRIRGTRFGEYGVSEETLRSLYEALDFLYGTPSRRMKMHINSLYGKGVNTG